MAKARPSVNGCRKGSSANRLFLLDIIRKSISGRTLFANNGNGGRPATAFVLTVRIVKRRAQLELGAPRRVDVVYATKNQEQVVAAPTPCRFHQPGKCPHGENVIFISNSSLAQ